MRHYALAAALLISAPAALAQSGQSDTDKTPTQQEIWQGKLYEWLTEMVLARDELLTEGYAVVMEGIEINSRTTFVDNVAGASPFAAGQAEKKPVQLVQVPVPSETPFIRIYARKGLTFDYRAQLIIQPIQQWEATSDQQRHVWRETMHNGLVDRYRRMAPIDPFRAAPPWVYREKGVTFPEWLKTEIDSDTPRHNGFTPYDSFVLPTGLFVGLRWNAPPLEKTLYLLDPDRIEPDLGDTLKSIWMVSGGGWKNRVTMNHTHRRGWMPTDAEYTTLQSPKGWEKVNSQRHLRLFDWKERKGRGGSRSYMLPGMVEYGENINGRADWTVTYYIKMHWLIAGDVPAEIYDPATVDPRQPLLDEFDIEHMGIDSDGQLEPAPLYEPPPDLVEQFGANEPQ